MSDPRKPSPFDSLDKRLKAVRDRRSKREGKSSTARGSGGSSGLGVGMRIATEIVASIGVGVAIGLFLDAQLGTKPWLMLLFILLGTAAAFYNVVRVAKGLERRSKEDRDNSRPK
ncbi:AtpZ/AtpI family protein [Fodinicurvata sediminis]|uniref:AtpZ/AtpI family protein n=1 Tax=Fodinicurvata sediminis TaxID=1121832 RepID=UPI0003B3102E|nr:AtpZ/AtpI family protein [Fodinicurvata sediminis]